MTMQIDPRRAVDRCERLAALGRVPSWWRVVARRRWIRAFEAVMATDITVIGEMLREIYPTELVEQLNRPAASLAQLAPSRSWGGGSTKNWGGQP